MIVLVFVIARLHASVKVHVSVTGPPHGPGNALNVEVTVPLIRHVPLAPLVYASELATVAPQATVIGCVAANIATGAGLTVIILDTGASGLPHTSAAVHVSIIVPPHAPGAAEKVEVPEVPLTRHDPLNPLV